MLRAIDGAHTADPDQFLNLVSFQFGADELIWVASQL
jgi:hypothetical protein